MNHHFGRRPPYYKPAATHQICQCRIRLEEKQKKSLQAHVHYLIRGILNLLREVPPLPRMACIVVGVGILLVVSFLLNGLMQLVTPFMNVIYTVLGILASAIAVYEFGKRLEI